MARNQMSLCTLTFIVWGRRELLRKRDKDCQQRPGLTPTPGLFHTCQRVQRACPCSAAWERSAGASRTAGGRERRAPTRLVPQKQTWYPKKKKAHWRSQDWGTGGGGEDAAPGNCSRGILQHLFPVPEVGVPGQDRVGNHPPGGFPHMGPCLIPCHGVQCQLGGADPLTAAGPAGIGGPGALCPPRGLGGGGAACCATACSSMTNGAIRAEA